VLEHLIQDLRYAIRVHSKRPILLLTTTISIGIGVGVNVAMYSVLRTVLTTGMTATAPDTIPVAPIAVFILMLTVGIVAALRPALRATALDPVGALRQD
jgi:ABC-type antimicrobial peptide transport system permease subunit